MIKALTFAAVLLLPVAAPAETPFPPLEAWKSAVLNGDQASIEKLYSSQAVTDAGRGRRVTLQDESAFWSSLHKTGMTDFHVRLLEITRANGTARLRLRLSLISSDGSPLFAGFRQQWAQQSDGWKIVGEQRGAALAADPTRTLPQPATPNVNLYSEPREAEAELKAALAKAGKEHKRVLVMFGGNWCYDCHVLDTTFHSADFAPLVNANYVVVHINIGDDGNDNHDLAARLGVALDKGVPSLGVLNPDGTVVYAQKNGEFEATEKIGPADVRAFLEKWRPTRG